MAESSRIKMDDVRAKFPQYSDISDEQLLGALHKKHYSDMPEQQFMGMIDRPQAAAAPQATPSRGIGQTIAQTAGNFGAGLVRGAGSIGATLLAPIDVASDALDGKGLSLQSNRERRAAMDGALSSLGAETDSMAYGAGKLTGEIAGTAGAGGAAAGLVARVAPGVAQSAPAFMAALGSGGADVGGLTGAAGLGARTAGGAVSGALSSGLVDPSDTAAGGVVGAVAPNALRGLARVGEKAAAGSAERLAQETTKFNRAAPQRETLRAANEAGYVVPPNLVEPSLKNSLVESLSGKQATSQLASVRNQDVTEGLVRRSLGLADDAPLSKSALEQIRKVEGGAYKKISDLSPEAGQDLETLKRARNEAQGWFNAYNRSASPDDLAKAKGFRDMAEGLELRLEGHAEKRRHA